MEEESWSCEGGVEERGDEEVERTIRKCGEVVGVGASVVYWVRICPFFDEIESDELMLGSEQDNDQDAARDHCG